MFTELIISAEKCFCGDLRFIGGFSSDPRLIPDMYYCPSLNNPSIIIQSFLERLPIFYRLFIALKSQKSRITLKLLESACLSHLYVTENGCIVQSQCV